MKRIIFCFISLLIFLNITNASSQDIRESALKHLVDEGHIPAPLAEYLVGQWLEFGDSFKTYLKEFRFYYGLQLWRNYKFSGFSPSYRKPAFGKEEFEQLYKSARSIDQQLELDDSKSWEILISFLPFLEKEVSRGKNFQEGFEAVANYLKGLSIKKDHSLIFKAGVCASFGISPEDDLVKKYQEITHELMKDTGPIIGSLVLDYKLSYKEAEDLFNNAIPRDRISSGDKDYAFILQSWRAYFSEAIFESKLKINEISSMLNEFKKRGIDYPSRFLPEQWKYIFEGNGDGKVLGFIVDEKDHNGASLNLQDEIKGFIENGYKISYFEVDTLWDFIQALDDLQKSGGVDTLLLVGHGRPYRVGEYINLNDLDGIKLFKDSLDNGLRDAVKPGAEIILLSCTVGSHKDVDGTIYDPNITDFFYKCFPQISSIYAPADMIHSMKIEFDPQGDVAGVKYDTCPAYNPVLQHSNYKSMAQFLKK